MGFLQHFLQNDTQHNRNACRYAECCYAEYHYAVTFFIDMLSFVMLSVLVLNVVILNVVMENVGAPMPRPEHQNFYDDKNFITEVAKVTSNLYKLRSVTLTRAYFRGVTLLVCYYHPLPSY
jgi:hypothetical protein